MFDRASEPAPFLQAAIRKPRRIGAVLVERGDAAAETVGAALAAQPQSRARLGAILSARGWVGARAVAAAAAEQQGLDLADPETSPVDPALGAPRDLPVYLRRRLAPWRREGVGQAWIATDVESAAQGLADLTAKPERARLALTDPASFDAAMLAAYGPAIAARAAARSPEAMSARRRTSWAMRAALWAALVALIAWLVASPSLASGWAFLALTLLNAGNGALRIAALGTALHAPAKPAAAAGSPR
jgi:hypothetical protein